jgi:hypothetical protein
LNICVKTDSEIKKDALIAKGYEDITKYPKEDNASDTDGEGKAKNNGK